MFRWKHKSHLCLVNETSDQVSLVLLIWRYVFPNESLLSALFTQVKTKTGQDEKRASRWEDLWGVFSATTSINLNFFTVQHKAFILEELWFRFCSPDTKTHVTLKDISTFCSGSKAEASPGKLFVKPDSTDAERRRYWWMSHLRQDFSLLRAQGPDPSAHVSAAQWLQQGRRVGMEEAGGKSR